MEPQSMNDQNKINHNIGEHIRTYRKKQSLTQDELAARSGIHVSTIKKYETGLITPKYMNLQKIADALNIDFYKFFDR